MSFTLFGEVSSLNNMEEVRDNTARCEALTDIIEIKSPWVGQAMGEDLKLFFYGMKSPNPSINKISFILSCSRFANV